ncbi:unnamed protein product [Cylicocyclus nassatus]|uniref:Uncharacterized protein n=1 Tax=Cylicocyclus nassatus TaxID=53992 RepID=A0AA36H861_CYLNA|nr:unnamed protein product [Cylicocyclus nassatus]
MRLIFLACVGLLVIAVNAEQVQEKEEGEITALEESNDDIATALDKADLQETEDTEVEIPAIRVKRGARRARLAARRRINRRRLQRRRAHARRHRRNQRRAAAKRARHSRRARKVKRAFGRRLLRKARARAARDRKRAARARAAAAAAN